MFRTLVVVVISATLVSLAGAEMPVANSFDQIGAEAQKQYSGDGIGITQTDHGATIKSAFQRLEGQATVEGLWLHASAGADPSKDDRLRVRAVKLGRGSFHTRLPSFGEIHAAREAVAWLRRGLLEEYTTSMGGIRQDFVVLSPPDGSGELTVSLELTGVHAELATYGAKLTVTGSGRELAYSRLHVTDATGRELAARLEVRDAGRLEVRVDDQGARYPVRIDPTFSDADWVSMGGVPGTNGTVSALAVDSSGNVYAGGSFTLAGNTPANRIAKWDGSSWSALGSGMNNTVSALAISSSGELYAGGSFTTAGGGAANRIAKWNGSSWSPVGTGMNGSVYCLAISGSGQLYAGGSFSTASGVSASGIAKWDGSTWSALGSGTNAYVSAITVGSSGELYAGGVFSTAGGVTANGVAKWNGNAWSALGSGMGVGSQTSGWVYALAVSGSGELYAGGYFTVAGGVSANYVAKWNGSDWSTLGSGVNGRVYALALSGTDLYAGGEFFNAGGATALGIAKWNGSYWIGLGSGVNMTVSAVVVSGSSELYAGGNFTTADGEGANYIAKWTGSPSGPWGTWRTLGSGMNGTVSALVPSGSEICAGGSFTTAGGVTPGRVAKWNGSAWSIIYGGMDGDVLALAFGGSGELYAGGHFFHADGLSANSIAKFTAGIGWRTVGSGMNSDVLALAVSGSELYAGGRFTLAGGIAANCVAKWKGSAWSALGSGMNGKSQSVWSLALRGSELFAGGDFTSADATTANYIAMWNGSRWNAVGTGMSSIVRALAVIGSELYAGGEFGSAGGTAANHIAKWDGSSWSALGSGMNGNVYVLAAHGSELYAGGTFTSAGGVSANRVAKWNGSAWSALGSGTNGPVSALAFSNTGALYVGGNFTTAGGKVSAYMAMLNLADSAIAVSGNGAGIPNNSSTPGVADGTEFGGVAVASGSVTRIFTITNTGAGTLDLLSSAPNYVTVSGAGAAAFTVSTQPSSGTVDANGGIQTFAITFDPAAAGVHGATVRIANDDPNKNPFSFAVQGSGVGLPQVASPTSTDVAPGAATLGGNVTDDGGAAITECGVVYALTATNSDPDLGESGVIALPSGGTTGAFTIPVTSLMPGTAYSFKVYATNSLGNGYSAVGTFTTLSPSQGAVAWAEEKGLTGTDSGLLAMPFHDGVENLLKYAFNLDGSRPDSHEMLPNASGTSGLPAIATRDQAGGQVLRFEYLRRLGSGLIYTPQISGDLQAVSWVDVATLVPAPVPTVTPVDAQWERVVLEVSLPGADSEFARVEVQAP